MFPPSHHGQIDFFGVAVLLGTTFWFVLVLALFLPKIRLALKRFSLKQPAIRSVLLSSAASAIAVYLHGYYLTELQGEFKSAYTPLHSTVIYLVVLAGGVHLTLAALAFLGGLSVTAYLLTGIVGSYLVFSGPLAEAQAIQLLALLLPVYIVQLTLKSK